MSLHLVPSFVIASAARSVLFHASPSLLTNEVSNYYDHGRHSKRKCDIRGQNKLYKMQQKTNCRTRIRKSTRERCVTKENMVSHAEEKSNVNEMHVQLDYNVKWYNQNVLDTEMYSRRGHSAENTFRWYSPSSSSNSRISRKAFE